MSDDEFDVVGKMVVDARGRVGVICNTYTRTVRIQYGADGPYATLPKKHLRPATVDEILEANINGFGGNES